MRFMSRIAPFAAFALLLATTACSSDDEEPNEATIETSEYAFTVSDGALVPGINTISLHNAGAQDHHLQLVRLDEGKTVDDFLTAFASGPPPSWASLEGGVGVLSSGGEASATLNLREGTYAFLCFIEDDDGVPHFAKGMQATVEVTGDEVVADAPEEDITIDGTDYALDAPESVEAGAVTLRFNNKGQDLHEASIIRFPAGTEVDVEAIVAYFAKPEPQGPPPFPGEPVSVGGAQGIPPGASQLATVNLEAGSYLVVCFIPNAEGVPHIALGMAASFVVE